eukprot:320117-Chlamydomonas_euryale.AAC.1
MAGGWGRAWCRCERVETCSAQRAHLHKRIGTCLGHCLGGVGVCLLSFIFKGGGALAWVKAGGGMKTQSNQRLCATTGTLRSDARTNALAVPH